MYVCICASQEMRRRTSRQIVGRGLLLGGFLAGSLSLFTLLNRKAVVDGLTTIPEVRVAAYGVMPLVLACQALKGLAYPVSGGEERCMRIRIRVCVDVCICTCTCACQAIEGLAYPVSGGEGSTRLDSTRLDSTRLDSTRQDMTGHDKDMTRQDMT